MKNNVLKNQNLDVNKSLTPEEISILGNIQSMVGELLNQSGFAQQDVQQSAQQPEQPPAQTMKAEDSTKTTEEMQTSIEDEAKKDIVSTESDSSTASDNAEERIDEQMTEQTEEGVAEVSKALAEFLKSYTVKKDPAKKINPVIGALGQLANANKSLKSEVLEVKNAMAQLLDGLVIIEQMKSMKSQEIKSEPITTQTDAKDFIKMLVSELKGEVRKSEDENLNNNQIIRKNLSNFDVLKGLIANKS